MSKQPRHRGMPVPRHVLWAAFAVSVVGSFPIQAKTCLFGEATYKKVKEDPDETELVLEPATQARGILLRRGAYRHQYFLDMPNNPPPGYQMGIMDPLTQISYPTFYPLADSYKQINGWPRSDGPAPDWLMIKGLGWFRKVCPD